MTLGELRIILDDRLIVEVNLIDLENNSIQQISVLKDLDIALNNKMINKVDVDYYNRRVVIYLFDC